MLDSLTFLLEKLFLLAHFRVFRSRLSPEGEREKRVTKPSEREGVPGLSHHPPYQRGDLLEVHRTLFTHFGIYLGDNRVAHLIPDILPVLTCDKRQIQTLVTNTRLVLGVLCKNATIRVDTVEEFAYGATILLNTMDGMFPGPLENGEVARRAERLVGATPYSLLWNNCEHFVTDCRYGTGVSLQTDKFCDWLKSMIRDHRSVPLAAFLGVVSVAYLGMSPCTALPSLLIPFTLWMVG